MQTNQSSLKTEFSAEATSSTSSALSSTYSASSITSSVSYSTAMDMLSNVPAQRTTQPNQQQKPATLYLNNVSLCCKHGCCDPFKRFKVASVQIPMYSLMITSFTM